MGLLDTIGLIILVTLAVLGGTHSKANTQRKLNRMINDEYDKRYKNKK